MARFLVVSAADQPYLPLALGAVRSLLPFREKLGFEIALLDLGLSAAGRQELEALGVTLAPAGVDFDYPARATLEARLPFIRAMTARPFIPTYFPGHAVYVWMDADAWVQTEDVLKTITSAGADDADLYVVAEYDRAYRLPFESAAPWQIYFNWYKKFFPPEVANQMSLRPMLNSGLFRLSGKAGLWALWQEQCRQAFASATGPDTDYMMAEQLALNVAAYLSKYPLNLLPVEYNWLVHLRLPLFDEESGLLVRPDVPHTPLSLVHLAGDSKNGAKEIATRTGGRVMRALYQTS